MREVQSCLSISLRLCLLGSLRRSSRQQLPNSRQEPASVRSHARWRLPSACSLGRGSAWPAGSLPMAPIPLRNMLVLWAQLVSMSESRQVVSWRGAYLHPPQVRNAELLPELMWVQAARLAWALGSVPTSCSAERDVRSPCSRFLSKVRLVSI